MSGDVEGPLAEACAELARTMAGPDAADAVLPGIATHAARVLGVRTAGVVLRDAEGGIVLAAAADEQLASYLALEQHLGEGPTVDALQDGATYPVHTLVDVRPSWPRWVPEAGALGVGAWLAVPSDTDDATTVVTACSTRPRHWHDNEVAAAQVLANLASGWLAHAHELAEVRRTAEQLQEALDNRLVIEQAKGIIAGELGCTLDQAFSILRRHARSKSATVRSVAQAVVELGLRPPAPPPSRPPAHEDVS
jgi:GAF domain-containing protein